MTTWHEAQIEGDMTGLDERMHVGHPSPEDFLFYVVGDSESG